MRSTFTEFNANATRNCQMHAGIDVSLYVLSFLAENRTMNSALAEER